ncbi:MAG: hypothetical protein U5Q44_11685 [Dehalococcoidia bacterium]|nr:hypothetical protein [Dehalococcoidia bacterium]
MPAEDVTCTFTNVYDPNILTLQKEVDTSRDPGTPQSIDEWTLSASGAGVDMSGSSGVRGHVAPGTLVTISESGGPWSYTPASIMCDSVQLVAAPGESSLTFPMPPDDTTCTFTNDFVAPTLTLEKVIDSAGDESDDGEFRIAASHDGSDVVSATGADDVATNDEVDFATDTVAIQPGQTVSLHETFVSGSASGLDHYSASARCYRNGNIMSFNPLDYGIHPQPGDDYVCTIVNTRKTTTVTITKDTVDASREHHFAGCRLPLLLDRGRLLAEPRRVRILYRPCRFRFRIAPKTSPASPAGSSTRLLSERLAKRPSTAPPSSLYRPR